jgi:hypothetical protein
VTNASREGGDASPADGDPHAISQDGDGSSEARDADLADAIEVYDRAAVNPYELAGIKAALECGEGVPEEVPRRPGMDPYIVVLRLNPIDVG